MENKNTDNKHIKWMDISIKTKILTNLCFAGSGEEGVMEDVKEDKCAHDVNGTYIKARVLTGCSCASSCEDSDMEKKKTMCTKNR